MALNEKERILVEDVIMDLHFAAQKYVESEKDIHRKLLELNIQDALDIFESIKDKVADDEMRFDYKIHLFVPFHVWELVNSREQKED